MIDEEKIKSIQKSIDEDGLDIDEAIYNNLPNINYDKDYDEKFDIMYITFKVESSEAENINPDGLEFYVRKEPKSDDIVGLIIMDYDVRTNIKREIEKYQRQFLVFSFLYYHMNESIIDDKDYDNRCNKLVSLMSDNPKIAQDTVYYNLCRPLMDDETASGFYIKKEEYPTDIISVAARLCYIHHNKPCPFEEFISRYGLKLDP